VYIFPRLEYATKNTVLRILFSTNVKKLARAKVHHVNLIIAFCTNRYSVTASNMENTIILIR